VSRHNDAAVQKLLDALGGYESNEHKLPGIRQKKDRLVFIKQVLDSIRRVNYVSVIEQRPLSADRANPQSVLFDPIKAALIHKQAGNIDEACWLVFLFVHFGKHNSSGYRLISDVYGKLKQSPYWTWQQVSANPELFRDWLREHQESLKGPRRGFGNHRKYQSLDADKPAGTGEAVVSYVTWVMQYGGHGQLIQHALQQSANDPRKAFRWLYTEMERVVSFGRTAKFDYLTMLGKAGLAAIEPDSAYLGTATGPKTGARLMLEGCTTGGKLSVGEMEERLSMLAQYLGVNMQVIEDSLCNWQKKPDKYKLFSG
jgi:hypothetical protein